MTEELIETLRIIIERYNGRTTGSVFIPMKDFPWFNERDGQLTKLHKEGMITKPMYSDNGATITLTKKGRDYFNGVLFPSQNTPMTCPICGYQARVISTDAERSWAEILCENCATYAIMKDALNGIPASDLPLLSGFYRNAVNNEPLTVQCDSQKTVKKHVDDIRARVSRKYQIELLLRYYYQRMKGFEDEIPFEDAPAIAYAKNNDDLKQLALEAVDKGYACYDNNAISITQKGKKWLDSINTVGGTRIMSRDEIFISHRATDAEIADVIKDFLVNTGIPNDKIFCSSLPGNDVNEKISEEVKTHLKKSVIIILLLSADYYHSAFCLNEAGIAWYLDEVVTIPIGLPEINHTNMYGFLGAEYKLRRLDDNGDIAYLYDQAKINLGVSDVSYSTIIRETQKLKERYEDCLSDRSMSIPAVEASDVQSSDFIKGNEHYIDYDDDIWEDGYHDVKDGDGKTLQRGQFINGTLVDGIVFNIVLRVARGDEDNETPVLIEELRNENWHYYECGQYQGAFELMIGHREMIEEGLQFYYVVDKKVRNNGKVVKPTFTNFRSLESFLSVEEPDYMEFIKTGVHKYEETDYADIEL